MVRFYETTGLFVGFSSICFLSKVFMRGGSEVLNEFLGSRFGLSCV